MKRWGMNLIGLVVIVGALLAATPLVTRDQTTPGAAILDQLNPLVPTRTVYVRTDCPSVEWTTNAHGGRDYRYRLVSYTATGARRRLLLTVTDAPLAKNQLLAVRAKGQTVIGWHKTTYAHLPRAVQHRLR
ncbi:DUF1093 domain-containing protein [Lacticaseibacillus daqingensis]|uniref:DUF1093 domain-containing protein n=1 Tax=Lacticaseibacillus daqingensis TaxID=2486014 RepID=UPI000F79E2B0|nr:DUF1093 domain-containing protein [Lacticaseibacillus daqingensis]